MSSDARSPAKIEILDHRAWRVICRADGVSAGLQRKHTHARLWLRETLTGGLPRQAPQALRLRTPEFLRDHTRFALGLKASTARRLNEHARRLLDAHGRRHEPLTWSPRVNNTALDQLPGPDPDAIDPHAVQTAIANQPTARHAANELRDHGRAPAVHRPHTPASSTTRRSRPRFPVSGSRPCSAPTASASSSITAPRHARSKPPTRSDERRSATNSSRTAYPSHPRTVRHGSHHRPARRTVHLSPTTAPTQGTRVSTYHPPQCPPSFDPFSGRDRHF